MTSGRPQRLALTVVRKAWRKMAMRGLTASDNYGQLNRLYAVPDPWNMTAPSEQRRFEMTNTLIAQRSSVLDTILEVGCGEGHQSEHLKTLCTRLDGVDVSDRAVERARQRVPGCRFGVGTLQSMPWSIPDGGYDLVVACEVLYYISDVAGAVRRMSELGRACLITFFAPAARVVVPQLGALHEAERGWFFHDPYPWLWMYWPTRRP